MSEPIPIVPSASQDFKDQATNENFKNISDRFITNIIKDESGTPRVLMGKGLDGFYGIRVSRDGFDVTDTTNKNLIMSSDFSFVKETWLQMHPQWDNSWTANTTYTDVVGSLNVIDFDDWPDHNWYFEMIGKTDANTGYYRLYNITAGAAVAGSEISTTSTTPTRIRSSAITKPTGVNAIKIQHRISASGGADLVNSIMSRSVFRIDI